MERIVGRKTTRERTGHDPFHGKYDPYEVLDGVYAFSLARRDPLLHGCGGIGIEALSRGASYAVFVEKNPKAAACIRENLAFTKLAEDGKLLNMDVLQALRSLEGKGVFDIIFMDPPYNNELERQVLEYLKDSTVADKNTLIIVEADLQTDFSYVESLGYRQLRSKEYKTNKHVFLERA